MLTRAEMAEHRLTAAVPALGREYGQCHDICTMRRGTGEFYLHPICGRRKQQYFPDVRSFRQSADPNSRKKGAETTRIHHSRGFSMGIGTLARASYNLTRRHRVDPSKEGMEGVARGGVCLPRHRVAMTVGSE